MPVAYSDVLAKSCRAIFRQFGVEELSDSVKNELSKKNRGQRTSPVSEITLNGSDRAKVFKDQDRSYFVHPFGDKHLDASLCWIGFKMEFEYGVTAYELRHVQLILVRGAHELRPILRAEWDATDQEHAQPHWHMYSAGGNDPYDREWEGMQRALHLAMCAHWHDGSCERAEAHKLRPSSDKDITVWLEKAIQYIHAQANYGIGKLPDWLKAGKGAPELKSL